MSSESAPRWLGGWFLIATPRLRDPNFARTVLLVFEHNEEGAAGVVLNRRASTTIGAISEQIFERRLDWDKPIGVGGPVPGPMIALHQRPELADRRVLEGVHSTMDSDKLRLLAERREEPSLILVNYAGWGPGQLESELRDDSWFVLPATADEIFWPDDRPNLWQTLVRRVSAESLSRLFNVPLPKDPSLN